MTLVTGTQTTHQPLTNGARLGATMTGKYVTLVDPVGTDGYSMPHYWTSGDGNTWTDAGALPSVGTTGPSGTVVPTGMVFSQIVHVSKQTIGGQEKLCIWHMIPEGIDSHLIAGTAGLAYYEAWWDGTSTFTSARGGYFHGAAASTTTMEGAAVYDGANWYSAWYIASSNLLIVTKGTPGSWLPSITADAGMAWGSGGTGITGPLDLAVSGSTILVVIPDNYRGQISVQPATISGSVISFGTVERVDGYGYAAASLDGSGNLDIVYALGNTALYHRKRVGLSSYGGATPIDAVNPTNPMPCTVRDLSSGDLWLVYDTSTSQTNGEVKYGRLHSGTWQVIGTLAGGDAAGYRSPRIFSPASGQVSAIWLKGMSSPRALYYLTLSAGTTPSAPTSLTTGNVLTVTPTLTYAYVNVSAGDPQGWNQYQLSSDGGSTVAYDSGQVATASTSISVPGGAGLTYNVTWYWRVRTWDALSNNGTGAAGPWSGWTAIVPVHGGTVTVTDVYSAGSTSTSLIQAPTHQVDTGWSQTDGHNGDMVQELIWDSIGSTILLTGSQTPLSPVVASGGSVRTAVQAYGPANGAVVKVQMLVRDETTGLWSQSSLTTYTVTYAPPPAPTGLTFTPNSDLGYGTLAWTNDVSAVTAEVQMQDVTGTWIERSSGTLITSVPVHPACGVPYAYRVRTTDSTGNASTWTTITNQVLDGQGDLNLSIWLNDTETGDAVAVGTIDTEQSLGLNQMEIERVFNPPGVKQPKTSYDATALWEEGDLSVIIMPNVLADGSITDVDATVRQLEALVGRHFTCLWREPTGIVTYVKCSKFRREPTDAGLYRRVQFSTRETLPPKVPFL